MIPILTKRRALLGAKQVVDKPLWLFLHRGIARAAFAHKINPTLPPSLTMRVDQEAAIRLLDASEIPCPNVGKEAVYGKLKSGWRVFERASGEDSVANLHCTVCDYFTIDSGNPRFAMAIMGDCYIHPPRVMLTANNSPLLWSEGVGFDPGLRILTNDPAPGIIEFYRCLGGGKLPTAHQGAFWTIKVIAESTIGAE